MNESDFHSLCLEDRAKMLWEKGEFVQSITYYHYCLLLYSIGKQFIELFYDKDTRRIVWISPATQRDLKKYLNDVQLPR